MLPRLHPLFLFLILLVCSCEEFSSKKIKEAQQKKAVKTTPLKDSTAPVQYIVDTNLLTTENAALKLEVYGNENTESKVRIQTKFGAIICKLYKDTPLHRANFVMLTKKGYFDSTLFYRIIPNFVVQGGNSDRDYTFEKMKQIGTYTIPEEIQAHHFHKRGALAMAVSEQFDVLPELRTKNSSPYNFYIVQNGPISDEYMDAIEKEYNITIPEYRREVYRAVGGTPHLDDNYTVFGEVISGIHVIDKLAAVEKDSYDFPKEKLFLTVELIK
jgi:peptidyl-prolyl cis-trans isomerase A (cyclophilin A)